MKKVTLFVSIIVCFMLVLTVTVPSIAVEKSKSLDDNSGKALFSYNGSYM